MRQLSRLLLLLALAFPTFQAASAQDAGVLTMHYDDIAVIRGSTLPTDFLTYQGELLDDGQPAEGTRSMQFRFFDAAVGGTQLGFVTINDVPVENGRFSVPIYTGFTPSWSNLWLQIHIADSESGLFELLGRQELTAAPFARWAQVAGEAELPWIRIDDSLSYGGRVGIGTTAPIGKLHVQGVGSDEVSIYGSSSVPMLHFRNTGNARDWVFRHDGTNFHLQQEVAEGTELMTWNINGNVGIGTTAPAARLDVTRGDGSDPSLRAHHSGTGANNAAAIQALVDGSGFGGNSAVAVNARASATTGSTMGTLARSDSSDGIGAFGFASATTGSAIGVLGRSNAAAGSGVWAVAGAASGTGAALRAEVTSTDGYAGHFSGGRSYFQGPVGLGTESPNARLHVAASGPSVPLRVQLDGGTKLKVDNNGGVAVGVNATPPVDGLFVQGPIQIPSTQRWLSISGRTFVNEYSLWSDTRGGASDGLRISGDVGLPVVFSAPVQIPHGAVMTELRALVTDEAPVENIRVRLLRASHSDATAQVLAEVLSSNSVIGKQVLASSSVANATIDNQNFSYEIRVSWDIPPSLDSIRLNTVRIAYNVTSPMP
jgi:hypothetical protein